jgi:hypothetical protein
MVIDDNNQENSFDSQNNEINIEQLYNDFIREIDLFRSRVDGKKVFPDKISKENVNVISTTTEVSDFPVESRCHAFYRLIGLPVVSNTFSFYSPGFNKDVNIDKQLLERQVTIANQVLSNKNLIKIFDLRESFHINMTKKFELQNFESGIIALTNSNNYNRREFNLSIRDSNPSDIFESIKQIHSINSSSFVNSLGIPLSYYKDDSGNSINGVEARQHIIKPFIVDPRIDYSVGPAERRIAAPFLLTKNSLKLNDDVYLKRPYIETVCRVRLNPSNNKDHLTETQLANLEAFKNSDTFKNLNIVQIFNTLQPNEKEQLFRFINIFRAMGQLLIKSYREIEKTESLYDWIPIPNKNGPEYGSDTRDVTQQSNAVQSTQRDQEIKNKTLKAEIDSILIKVLGHNPNDLGDFVFSDIHFSPDPENSRSFGNINKDNLDHMLQERKNACKRANDALKNIEIITGEFSGFGFCDIIAIYSALWLIDIKYLEGLLDDEAFFRAQSTKGIVTTVILPNQRPSIQKCLEEFEKKVKEMYELMEKIYQDLLTNIDLNNTA